MGEGHQRRTRRKKEKEEKEGKQGGSSKLAVRNGNWKGPTSSFTRKGQHWGHKNGGGYCVLVLATVDHGASNNFVSLSRE